MSPFGIFIIVFVLAGGCIWGILYLEAKNKREKEALRQAYQDALKGTDKKLALNAGRIYYASLRGGALTIYDEQAIANDISTMN